MTEAWLAIAEAHADELARGVLEPTVDAIATALRSAPPVARASLLTTARALRRDGHATVDPFRFELALTRVAEREPSAEPLPARRYPQLSALAALEPDPGARALHVFCVEAAGGEAAAGFERSLTRFWLTGEEASGIDGVELGAFLSRTSILAALRATRAIGDASRVAREARVAVWNEAFRARVGTLGANVRALVDGLDESFVASCDATSADFALAATGDRAAIERLAHTLGVHERHARSSPEDVPSIARHLAAAFTLGLVAALDVEDSGLRVARERLARRLVEGLDTLFTMTPIDPLDPSLEPGLVRAVGSLVRDRVGAGDLATAARVLARFAETGAVGAGSAVPFARLVRLAEAHVDDEGTRRFLVRTVLRSALRRRIAWPKVAAKSGLGRLVTETADTAAGRALAAHLAPGTWHDADASELVEASEDAAGRALGEPGDDLGTRASHALAFWRASGIVGDATAKDAPRLLGVAAELRKRLRNVVVPARDALEPRPTIALHVDVLRGRHGERYLAPRMFRSTSGGLSTVARDDRYEVSLDGSRAIEAAGEALVALRSEAALGSAGRRHVLPVQRALAELLPSGLRARIGSELASVRGPLELTAFDPSLPWELLPLPAEGVLAESALALRVPTYRSRGRGHARMPARGRPIRSTLVLVDPHQPGATDEVELLRGALERRGLSLRVAETLEDARDALGRAWDVVHYAGHQGPTHDDSPALVLRDGALPILELVDRLGDEPPELLFLNACSTLVPSGIDRASGHVDFGGLEPIIASSVPQILGTLWDVKPPDTRFVEAFYGTLGEGASAIDALFEARRAVSSSLAWAGTAPAYVLYARRPD